MKFKILPSIQEVFFDIPYTTVKWNDGTTTTVKCSDEDVFSKEIGLSIAITKKYFEQRNSNHPWMVFNTIIKQSDDQTEKTAAKKAYKSEKKQKHVETVENESSNELDLLENKIRSKIIGSRFSFSDRVTIIKLVSNAKNKINQFRKENNFLLNENKRLRKEKENLENKIHNQRKELNNFLEEKTIYSIMKFGIKNGI